MIQPPSIIVHCDWGTAPGKRWMAKAPLRDGQYIAHAPEPVGELSTLIERIEFERKLERDARYAARKARKVKKKTAAERWG